MSAARLDPPHDNAFANEIDQAPAARGAETAGVDHGAIVRQVPHSGMMGVPRDDHASLWPLFARVARDDARQITPNLEDFEQTVWRKNGASDAIEACSLAAQRRIMIGWEFGADFPENLVARLESQPVTGSQFGGAFREAPANLRDQPTPGRNVVEKNVAVGYPDAPIGELHFVHR